MRANTQFLLVTQGYTVVELSLFILSDAVRLTVITETKLCAHICMPAHEEKSETPPAAVSLCGIVSAPMSSSFFLFFRLL